MQLQETSIKAGVAMYGATLLADFRGATMGGMVPSYMSKMTKIRESYYPEVTRR